MGRTLFDIQDDIRTVWDNASVNEETGEIEVNLDAVEALEMELAEKIEGVALLYKETRYEKDALKEEIKRLQERVKQKERTEESLLNYVQYATGGKKFETAKVKVSYRKSVRVEVDNVDELPEEFLRIKTTVEADKTALKEALKDGEIIEGTRLVETTNCNIK